MEKGRVLQDIETLIQKKQYRKISDLLQDMIDIEIEKDQSLKETLGFFNKVYDKLYYYIIFDKIDLDKSIVKQLESLAMPIQSKTEEEWQELFKKLRKAKK